MQHLFCLNLIFVIFVYFELSSARAQTDSLKQLYETAKVYENDGRWNEAMALLQSGVATARTAADKKNEAILTAQLAFLQRRKEDYDAALVTFRTARTLAESVGDSLTLARCLYGIGDIYYFKKTYYLQGDLAQSFNYVQRSFALREMIADKAGMAESLYRMGTILDVQGETEKAAPYFNTGALLATEANDRRQMANNFTHIAGNHIRKEEFDQALEYDLRALALSEEDGYKYGMAFYLANVGADYQSKGDSARALAYYQRSLAVSEELGHRMLIASSLASLADYYSESGDIDKAIAYYEKSLAVAEKAGLKRVVFSALLALGDICASRKAIQAATKHYERGLLLARQAGFSRGIEQASARLGKIRVPPQR